VLIHFNKKPADINCMKKHFLKASGEIKGIKSKGISINKLKALVKQEEYGKVTLNDMMMGMISSVLAEYFENHGDKSKEVTLMAPCAFRTVPRDPKDYKYYNTFVALAIYTDLIKDLKQAAIHCKTACSS
jgi:hypothetical protein